MYWWQSSFSPSSQSHSSGESSINNNTDAPPLSARGRRLSYGSLQIDRLVTGRKLRNLTDDVGQPSVLSKVMAHPLPLPEAALLKRDSGLEGYSDQSSKYILPLPEALTRAGENRIISHANRDKWQVSPSISSLRETRNIKLKRFQSFHKSSKGQNSASNSGTSSRPTSPIIDSLTTTTQTPLAMDLSVVNSPWMLPERRSVSVDNSPVSNTSAKSSIRSNSPLHNGHEVHLLPLPPGASSPPYCKPDSMPRIKTQSQWRKGKLIGRGTFGSVYVGSNRETGALCAMKEVELCPDDPKSAECIKQSEQEIKVLSQLKHPNIVQYFGSEIVDDRFYIYLEYVHPGSINKYARDHCGGMTESIVRSFTRHIVTGLAYLHSTKTIHRDIKGANLLVDANGVVKLADFGMAKHLNAQPSHLSLKGSPYWMAPELLQSGMQKDASPDLGLAIDIWSLGCTIIEMINGRPPWSEYEPPAAMFKVIKETPLIPDTLSPEGKDFLRCCFIRNPAERPGASLLLQHRFLNSNQDKAENQREHFMS